MTEQRQQPDAQSSDTKSFNPIIATVAIAALCAVAVATYALTQNDESLNQTETTQTTEDDESSSLPADDELNAQNSEAGSGDADEPVDSGNNVQDETVLAPEYVGLSEDEARQLAGDQGRALQIVVRDGDSQDVTLDYQPSRVNLELVDGFVVRAYVE